jgi:hypothetical protein
MKDKDKIVSIAPLFYQYPSAPKETIPEKHRLLPIDYKSQDIQAYDVLFFHRLMKKNYGPPSEIEVDQHSVKKSGDDIVLALGREWNYNVRTKSGDIIRIGTENVHTRVAVSHVIPHTQKDLDKKLLQEGKKFINDLLREAQRLKGQILNVRNEFETGDTVKLSLLTNVYLANYRSAQLMLEWADEHEQSIQDEVLRYDARHSLTDEQRKHIDKFSPAVGMYYASSISYFFMALEGFVNILYYGFVKEETRSDFFSQQKLDERLDISTKLLLMPSLCDGFKNKQRVPFLKDLSRLKNYRNFFFHSKLADSLKAVTFVEGGFLYRCDLEKDSNPLLPSQKSKSTGKSVLEFKKIVDSIIKNILDMMEDDPKRMVETFVLNSLELPLWRDKTGAIRFGTMPR